MNRRQLLKLLVSGAVGHTLDIDRLLWIPNTKTIFIPSPKQAEFLGIPYHESNATIGTWMGITRSVEPWDYKRLMDKLCLNLSEPQK